VSLLKIEFQPTTRLFQIQLRLPSADSDRLFGPATPLPHQLDPDGFDSKFDKYQPPRLTSFPDVVFHVIHNGSQHRLRRRGAHGLRERPHLDSGVDDVDSGLPDESTSTRSTRTLLIRSFAVGPDVATCVFLRHGVYCGGDRSSDWDVVRKRTPECGLEGRNSRSRDFVVCFSKNPSVGNFQSNVVGFSFPVDDPHHATDHGRLRRHLARRVHLRSPNFIRRFIAIPFVFTRNHQLL
jgi:hypothetical protein